MLTTIIFTCVSVWVLLSILLYFYQSRLIYHPYSHIDATPKDIGYDYEDTTFVTADNIKINAWWIPHPASKGTLLFFQGNTGNLSHRLESIRIFHERRLSVFIIDYRGYGKSQGNPNENGTYLDAEAAWQYLIREKKIDRKNIIIFGRSLGSAIAAWLAQKYEPMALIIESPFTSIIDMGKYNYPYLPITLIARINYSTKERISGIKVPILIIHSREDDVVPYKFGKQLFDLANEPKRFLDIRGGHNSGFLHSGDMYTNGLDNFIDKVLRNEIAVTD